MIYFFKINRYCFIFCSRYILSNKVCSNWQFTMATIRADFVGKNIPTAKDEAVSVYLEEIDDRNAVIIDRSRM
jgi:hypothetical protein